MRPVNKKKSAEYTVKLQAHQPNAGVASSNKAARRDLVKKNNLIINGKNIATGSDGNVLPSPGAKEFPVQSQLGAY